MDKKTKDKYLHLFISQANEWLYRGEGSNELKYLCGRIPENQINDWHFGYLPNTNSSLVDFIDEFGRKIKENPIQILEELGIIYKYYNKIRSFFYNNTLLIPFFDTYGNPITISGRTISNKEEQKQKRISKYKHLPFIKRWHVFNLDKSYKNILKKNFVIIVEGQFDCISGFINGLDNIVALGGSKFTFENIVLLKRFTTNFLMLPDLDEAGELGWMKATKQADKYDFNLTKLKVPFGHDLHEYILQNGSVDIDDLKAA